MINRAFEGSVDYLQILDQDGNVDQSLMPQSISDAKAVEMYKNMCFARAFDAKALSLQRQGRAVTYAPLIGQEATQIGCALAMRTQDVFVPNFRQHGVLLTRGIPLELIFLYWRGYEEGGAMPREKNCLPVIVPVATQLPHAAGVAFAQRYKKTDAVTIAFVGDGGTSEGDFYETLNFAGVFKLPLIVIIENNQWAISLPRSSQSAAQTLAQKGIAAGIRCMQVDGNDVFAVYKAVSDSIQNPAPVLIECVTYRMSMHTTADDPTKYRSDADVEAWAKKDPITRLRKYLTTKALWNDALEADMIATQTAQIDKAVETAEQFKPDPKSMFEHLYSFMPEILKQEYDDAVKNNFWQQK